MHLKLKASQAECLHAFRIHTNIKFTKIITLRSIDLFKSTYMHN